MAGAQARDDAGKWAGRELSDPEIEALARQADDQGYGEYPEPVDDRAFDRAMLAEDRRAEREEASWARWERRNR